MEDDLDIGYDLYELAVYKINGSDEEELIDERLFDTQQECTHYFDSNYDYRGYSACISSVDTEGERTIISVVSCNGPESF